MKIPRAAVLLAIVALAPTDGAAGVRELSTRNAAKAVNSSSECTPPVADASASRPLAPGDYTLTLTATEGSRAGARTSGLLRLLPTSPDDRSPRIGQRAASDLQPAPLYGMAELDWDAVGAPMEAVVETGDTLHPPSTSADPVYPGVLVLMNPQKTESVLVIGTLSNRRDGSGWLDGAGIGLMVRRVDARGFHGTWGHWGIVMDGSGYFCAERR